MGNRPISGGTRTVRYEVQAVEEGELPDGTDVVFVDRGDGTAVMLVSGRVAEVWAMMRAFEDSREPSSVASLLYAV